MSIDVTNKVNPAYTSNFFAKTDNDKNSGGNTAQTTDSEAVKLSISPEAMASHRQKLASLNTGTQKNTLEWKHTFIKQANNFSYANQHGYELAKEVDRLKGTHDENAVYTVSDKLEDCIKAYGKLYDNIKQGYADGTREKYVEDDNSATGFRKMTMEEELARLDNAWQRMSVTEGALAENARKASAAFHDTAEKLSKYRMGASFTTAYENLAAKGLTKNNDIAAKMTALADAWKEAYQSSGSWEKSTEHALSLLKDMFTTKD